MSYPPRYLRLSNFLALQQAGGVFDQTHEAYLDAELNNVASSIDQIVTRLQQITSAAGQLVGYGATTAQALAGSQRIVATVTQTVYTTTITYDASFTASSVLVTRIPNGTTIGSIFDSNAYTLSNSGGFLVVTLSSGSLIAAGDVLLIDAFSPGAGVLAKLASIANAQGASLVGIEDVGGLYASTTVEGALAEFKAAYNAYVTSIGSVALLFKKDGSVTATGPFNMGSQKISSLANGTLSTDAATLGQVNALFSGIAALQNYFLRKDVAIVWTASQDAGGKKLANLVMTDPVVSGVSVASSEAANKNYVDTVVSTQLAPINTQLTALGNPGAASKRLVSFLTPGSGVGFSWTVTDGITAAIVESWGGGGSTAGSAGGGGGAYTQLALTLVTGDVVSCAVGAGGANSDGQATNVYVNGVQVSTAGGGKGTSGLSGGVGVVYSSTKVQGGFTITGGYGSNVSPYVGGASPRGGAGCIGGGTAFGNSPGGGGSVSAAGNGAVIITY